MKTIYVLALAAGLTSVVTGDEPKHEKRQPAHNQSADRPQRSETRSQPAQHQTQQTERRTTERQTSPAPRPTPALQRTESRQQPAQRQMQQPERRTAEPQKRQDMVRTPNTDNSRVRRTSNGAVHYGNDGRVSRVERNGVTIQHSAGQRIIVNRPDGRTVVTNRAGRGFVQRDFAYSGRTYVARTYYVRDRVFARYYRPYAYHGIALQAYMPVRYYAPAFYGWAFRPWGVSVVFSWGWHSDPWAAWYRPYFMPAPYYPSAAYWLTDYLISSQLALAYQERQQQQMAAMYGSGSQITPEIRSLVANEVERQLEMERRDAASLGRDNGDGVPPWLEGANHVFVVGYNLEVRDTQQRVCSLGRGDVIQLAGPPQGASAAWTRVLASAGSSCPQGATVAVEVTDLQDMNNQMRESVNQGMGELYSKAGQGNVPPLPAEAQVAPTPAAFMQSAPPADSDVANVLTQQVHEADQIEQQSIAEAGAPPPPTPQRQVNLRVGQTSAEVMQLMGAPLDTVRLGDKEIHTYPNVKVVYNKGRVIDIQ